MSDAGSNNIAEPDWLLPFMQTVREPLLLLDGELQVVHANRAFYNTFKTNVDEVKGRRLYELDGGSWNIPALRKLLEESLPASGEVRDYKINHDFPCIGQRALILDGRVLDHANGKHVFLSIEDVTKQLSNQLEVARQRQWLATTLSSIGDAVIATDVNAHVTFMNPTAERLTGWTSQEAIGHPLHTVFNIVNEETRNLVESPVSKAIRMGSIVGLANHTMLIGKDGQEHPIDDSAAPIRDEAGRIIGVVMVFHDITERRAAERLQARLAEIVESSDDAIVAKDLNGVINAWNKGAERLFSYSAQEAIGKHITLIIPKDRYSEEQVVIDRIRRGERIDHFETIRQRKDGTLVPISLTVSPIKNRQGEVIGASKTARNISDRKRFEAEREAHLINEQSLRMEAEAANRSKDLFLATLSHELRTPLNAIVGWVSILRSQGSTEEDWKEGLEAIERNARVQTQLIDDVLDVSRIVSGNLKLNIQRCDFAAIINAALDTVRQSAEAKRISIETTIDPGAVSGTCDPTRIQQVVWNLLSNSVKFTPNGGKITIALDRERSMTRISVSDTGRGISKEFLPFVFDRFRQADSTTRRKFGGLGLGLSIVKQLVEMHGGTVRAESSGKGQGSKFTIDLPVGTVSPSPEEEPGDTDGPAADKPELLGFKLVRLDGLRILAVDDEADARRILSKTLSEAGGIVTTAGSAQEALASIERVQPHVLVSDLAMPDMDGYDLIHQLRAKGYTAQSLPAVALTAFAHKNYARNALLAGFQVHVPKPVDPHDLLAVIASITGRTGK